MPHCRVWLRVGAAFLAWQSAMPGRSEPPAMPIRTAESDHALKAGVAAWERGEDAAAVRLWLPLAETQNPDALFHLAQAYRLGRGVPADPVRATALYRQAAAQGHVAAAARYAIQLYADRREREAMPLLQAAADAGDAPACYLMGIAHFNGDWLPQDWPRAFALVSLAAREGLPAAKTALPRIAGSLDPEQLEEGRALIDILSSRAKAPIASRSMAVLLGKAEAAPPAAKPSALVEPLDDPAAQLRTRPARGVVLRLGAFENAQNAHRLRNRLRSEPLLAGHDVALRAVGRLTLVSVEIADADAAQAKCRNLQTKGYECVVSR